MVKCGYGADGTWLNDAWYTNPVTGDDPLHEFSAKLNGEPGYFQCQLRAVVVLIMQILVMVILVQQQYLSASRTNASKWNL